MKQIHKLTIRDFLGVEAVELEPQKLNTFAGGNSEGKTSVLKAIKAGLEGMPEGAVRQGASKAEVLVNLTDGLQIERTATAKGTYLPVKDAEGRQLPKPQRLLNSLRGAFAFNPVEFLGLAPKEQRQYVLQALPVELPPDACDGDPPHRGEHPLEYLQRRAKQIEADRRLLGRRRRDAEGEARTLRETMGEQPPDDDDTAPSQAEADEAEREARDALVRTETEHEHWQRGQQRKEEHRRSLRALETHLQTEPTPPTDSVETAASVAEKAWEKVSELEEALREARAEAHLADGRVAVIRERWAKYERAKVQREQGQAKAAELRQQITDLDTPAPDVEGARRALVAAQGASQAAYEAAQAREAAEQLKAAEERVRGLAAEYDEQTTLLDRYRSELPAQLVRQHAEKLEGLEIAEDGLSWQGRPLANLADSERLVIALTIVQQLAGDLRVICVDGLEKLSTDRQEAFRAAVAEDEFQYFVTRVGDPVEGEIAMESGRVVQGSLGLEE